MKGGRPARLPIAVLPLWDQLKFDYGDPAKPVAAAVPDRTITLPAGTTALEIRSFVTGHGQGNLNNCAEFCTRTHTFKVGAMEVSRDVWRNDCAQTGVPGQRGNFRSGRAGWCPGADVLPWVADVTSAMPAGAGSITVSYAVTPYENSCRPDSPMCGGCALGTGCAFDNGAHTAPVYVLSAAVIAYGQ
jgi:peptide-N-glycosidase F-like protein